MAKKMSEKDEAPADQGKDEDKRTGTDGDNDMVEEVKEEEAEATKPEAHKHGGKVKHMDGKMGKHDGAKKMKRKHGGHVPGMKGMERPDKRARGGGLADANPTTMAGRMSTPSFETKTPFRNGGGKGRD